MYDVYFLDGTKERFHSKEFKVCEGMFYIGNAIIPILNVKLVMKVKY